MRRVTVAILSTLLLAASSAAHAQSTPAVRRDHRARELCAASRDAARCERRVERFAARHRAEEERLRAAREGCKDQPGAQRRGCLRAHLRSAERVGGQAPAPRE